MMEKQRHALKLGIVIGIVFICQAIVFVKYNNFLQPALADTDCYMRLVRAEQLYDTGHWYDNTIYRSNFPFGETLHWTRLLDVLLLAGALIGTAFLPFHTALLWWGILISPVLLMLSLIAMFWAAKILFRPESVLRPCLLLICQMAVIANYSFARPDHHSLLVLGFIVVLALAFRMLSEPAKPAYTYYTGGVAALGMWVSVETLATVVMVVGTLVLLWVCRGQQVWLLAAQRVLLSLGLGAIAGVLIERAVGQWGVVEYDKISVVHIALFVVTWLLLRYISGFFATTRLQRVIGTIGLPLVGVGILALVFPGLLKGPYANVDARLIPIWLAHVGEVQPLLASDSSLILGFMGNSLWLLPYGLLVWRSKERLPDAWVLIHGGIILFAALSVYQVRWAAYAGVLLVFIMSHLQEKGLERTARICNTALRTVLQVAMILVVAFGTPIWSIVMTKPVEEGRPQAYSQTEHTLTAVLKGYEAPQTVLASVNYSPRILYETKHRVIATPYHRNTAGILYWDDFIKAKTDDAAREILRQRNVNLVVIGGEEIDSRRIETPAAQELFVYRVMTGKGPEWLKQVLRPENSQGGFAVFEVQH